MKPVFSLESCVVRPWRREDAGPVARWADNPRIARFMRDRFPSPYTIRDAKRWIRAANGTEPVRHFAIEVDGEAAGGIGFDPYEDVDRRTAEIGYWLAEPHWGRGIATAALVAVSGYAFEHFDVVRLQARVYEGNEPSMRVLEKAGYALEARLRKSVTKYGRTIDSFLYSRLKEV